jgi:hypothetical protein
MKFVEIKVIPRCDRTHCVHTGLGEKWMNYLKINPSPQILSGYLPSNTI